MSGSVKLLTMIKVTVDLNLVLYHFYPEFNFFLPTLITYIISGESEIPIRILIFAPVKLSCVDWFWNGLNIHYIG